jgi:hypothetical protein
MKYALPSMNKFPLNNLEDAKLAEEYFIKNELDIPIRSRREFCVNVSNYKKELGLKTHEKLASYAKPKLSKQGLNSFIGTRELYDESAAAKVNEIIKTAEAVDDVIEGLLKFDESLLIDKFWDNRLENPIITATEDIEEGLSMIKIGGKEISVTDLIKLAQNTELLSKHFTDYFISTFSVDPIKAITLLSDTELEVLENLI